MGLVLTFIALQVWLYGIASSLRGTKTDNLIWVCLLAALIGLSSGKSRLKGIHASAGIAVLGILGVWSLGARLAIPLSDLLKALIHIGPTIFPELGYRFDVDASGLVSAWNLIVASSDALLMRWQTWFIGLAANVNVNDALIRNMIWTLTLWLFSAWIGWFAAKRNAVVSLLPGIALLTWITSYSEYRVETLWGLVFIMLLLMGIWNYKKLIGGWETRRVDYSESIRYDNSQAVIIVAALVGIVAFITPSVSWRDVRDYFREREHAKKSETVKMLGIEEKIDPPKKKPSPKPSLPRKHLLTAGYAQSEKIVMTIKTGELPPIVIQGITTDAPRYYWRSVIYDQYVGAGWFSTSAPPQPIDANEPLIPGVLSEYKALHLNVQMQEPEGKLYWSGMLYSADIPLTVDWRLRPQSNLFADQTALLQADMFAARTDATTYKVEAYVPTPSINELRAASTAYPQHIRDLYLALPQSVPERVHRLAQEITHGKETPYDKAKAIESYLRDNYPYDLEISAPPPDRDVADYFLFDLRRGYCDYYATAMVVLARSSGIPARFVSGYSSGEYDAPNAQYIIRELHAHSWAEVYFPEIGWVEFEPTGHEPEIERVATKIDPASLHKPASTARRILFEITSQKIFLLLLPLGMIAILILLYFWMIEGILFMRLLPSVAVEILYKRLYRSGRPLAGEWTRAETAHEFTDKLIAKLGEISHRLDRAKLFERIKNEVEVLTDIYHTSLFSKQSAQKEDVRVALHVWQHLRWQLFVAKLNNFLLRYKRTSS